jgi:hypothetical protein
MPGFRARNEGEPLRIGDSIILQSVKVRCRNKRSCFKSDGKKAAHNVYRDTIESAIGH